MQLGQTATTLLLLGFISSCNNKSQDPSKDSLDEQGEENKPAKPQRDTMEIPRDASLPSVQIQSFESTSIQQAVVDLGKLEVLSIDHFRQAFPNQGIRIGSETLSSDNFKDNATLSINEFGLSLDMRNFQLHQAGLSESLEPGVTGIKIGDNFKKVFLNEQLECFYWYYEAGVLTCYLPDNWHFAVGFDGRNYDRVAKTGPVSITKAKKMARRKKVDWINWERVRSPMRD